MFQFGWMGDGRLEKNKQTWPHSGSIKYVCYKTSKFLFVNSSPLWHFSQQKSSRLIYRLADMKVKKEILTLEKTGYFFYKMPMLFLNGEQYARSIWMFLIYFKSAIFCMLTEALLVNQATLLLTKHGNKQEILVGMGIFPHKSLFSGNHIGWCKKLEKMFTLVL